MGEVVIDLGELPHGAGPGRSPDDIGADPPAGRRPAPARSVLAAIAVLLTGVLAGAGHPAPPVEPVIIPARLGDMVFPGSDDRHYFVVEGRTGGSRVWLQDRRINVYRLPEATLVSRTPVVVSGPVTRIEAVDGILLVSYQLDAVGGEATRAYAIDTGRMLWGHLARLISLSSDGRIALLVEGQGPAGRLRWSGLDPRTGAVVWVHAVPAGGTSGLTSYEGDAGAQLVTATRAGAVQVRDVRTGRITAAARVRLPAGLDDNLLHMWISDDLVMLGGPGGATAYALADLTPRWTSDIDLTPGFVLPSCGDAVCLLHRFAGLVVIDPATGRKRWAAERWAVAERVGDYLLATADRGTRDERTLSVLDPVTGSRHGSFGPWQVAGEPRPDGRVVAVRERLSERRVWYALLEPATLAVRVLGVAEQVTGGCEVTTQVVICRRIDASVGVWPLPAG